MILRHVIVSPHPDDAIWSCGGWIRTLHDHGASCLVVSIFDQSPHAGEGWSNEPWRRGAIATGRADEHRRALQHVGAHAIGLDFCDAAQRTIACAPAYADPAALFGPLPLAERRLTRLIADALGKIVGKGDRLYVPVASRGAHADHRIARRAAMHLEPAEIWLYDEFPYALPAPPRGWLSRLEPVELEPWIAAGLCYRSQVLALFGSAGAFRQALTDHAAAPCDDRGGYGVRFWRKSSAS